MRNRQSLLISLLLLGSLMLGRIAFSVRRVSGDQTGGPAKEGWRNFLEVLAGDQSKLELAVRQLEQASVAAPTDVHNLYTLGRAYFYDAITHNHLESAEKAEHTFSRVLELDPKHEALAFHGSVLTILSQGKELEKFRRGVREMNRMVQQNPDSLTARLSRGLTAQALPSEARPMMGNHDSVEDLEFASRAFEGIEFHYAPQAEVGSKAFVGEGHLLRGDIAKAQSSFKAALAVPLPSEPGAKAGRIVLQDIIRKRLNGSEQSLTEMLRQAGLGSCNTCHLGHLEAARSSLKAPETVVAQVKSSQTSHGMTAAEGELTVNLVGLKSNEGQVRLALFNSEKAFLHDAFRSGVAVIEQFQCYWQVSGLPAGSYALAVYQDKNGNGKLDRNMFGIPLEPYGFSNNARGVLGPPNFADARFQVSSSSTRIEVRLE